MVKKKTKNKKTKQIYPSNMTGVYPVPELTGDQSSLASP
jgi:hypothetical protein